MRTKERLYLYIFLLSFCTFIISPSILVLLEEQAEVAYYFNTAEEEEKKEEGKEKDVIEYVIFSFSYTDMACFFSGTNSFFYSQNMGDDFFAVPVLPPPEVNS